MDSTSGTTSETLKQQSPHNGTSRRVVYISSKEYNRICDQHPKVRERATLVDSLIEAYGLKKHLLTVIPTVASREHLLMFHTEEYVDCLEKIQRAMQVNYPSTIGEDSMYEEDIDYDNDQEFYEVVRYGFGYDCGAFSRINDYCRSVVGGTVAAANVLMAGRADVTINLNGGWHHAHVDEAAGFCYVNDIVIGVLTLLKKFKRILYVDLDIHHGDGVEEAFKYSDKVMTLSLHNYHDGFFPGTGGGDHFDKSCQKYLATNVPLRNGLDDTMFYDVFEKLFSRITDVFKPEVIVCQCGADGLTADPLGGFNLTSSGLVRCVELVLTRNVGTMLLGGGGYNIANTARCWTEIVASVVGVSLDDDIPDHEHLDKYGPAFGLSITPSNRKNENTREYVDHIVALLMENLQVIAASAGDVIEEEEGNVHMDAMETPTTTNLTENTKQTSDQENNHVMKNSNVEGLVRQKRVLSVDGTMCINESVVKKVCMDTTNTNFV